MGTRRKYDRLAIRAEHQKGKSIYRIAKELGASTSTIWSIVKTSTINLKISLKAAEWLRQHLEWFKTATTGSYGEYNLCTMEDEPLVDEILTALSSAS